jgi:hypothetical protein
MSSLLPQHFHVVLPSKPNWPKFQECYFSEVQLSGTIGLPFALICTLDPSIPSHPINKVSLPISRNKPTAWRMLRSCLSCGVQSLRLPVDLAIARAATEIKNIWHRSHPTSYSDASGSDASLLRSSDVLGPVKQNSVQERVPDLIIPP